MNRVIKYQKIERKMKEEKEKDKTAKRTEQFDRNEIDRVQITVVDGISTDISSLLLCSIEQYNVRYAH
jgi:hypothetical protein